MTATRSTALPDVRPSVNDQTHTLDDHVDVAVVGLERDAVGLALQKPVENGHRFLVVGLQFALNAAHGEVITVQNEANVLCPASGHSVLPVICQQVV